MAKTKNFRIPSSLRGVLIRDDNVECFLIQILEVDVCIQGSSQEEVLERLITSIRLNLEGGKEGKKVAWGGPVPDEFFTIWDKTEKQDPITRDGYTISLTVPVKESEPA